MQWVGTPRQVIDISSDEDEDEYMEPPAKKPKLSARKGGKSKLEERESGQSSFTQVDFFAKMRQKRQSRLDGDGFQIWQDSETEEDVEDDWAGEASAGPAAVSATLNSDDLENSIPETSDSSQHAWPEERKDEALMREAGHEVPQLRTPQKVRFVEVPSSQTPASTAVSIPRLFDRRHRSISRSPLKDRSINVQSPVKHLQSPQSQNMSMKMPERTRFANQEAQKENAGLYRDLVQCAAEATEDFSLRTCPMLPPPQPRLHRSTTVQDSQSEDLDALTASSVADASGQLFRTASISDSQGDSSNPTMVKDSQWQRPVRKLRRVATVQDSQIDDDDMEFAEDVRAAPGYGTHNTNYDDDDYAWKNHEMEETFDPAFSALDRDADRYGRTQTQTQQQRLTEIGEESETEDNNVDCGYATQQTTKAGTISDSASQEVGEPVVPRRNIAPKTELTGDPKALRKETGNTVLGKATSGEYSAYESDGWVAPSEDREIRSSPPPLHDSQMRMKQTSDSTEDIRGPSSPPPLRASQVSTIVPTQASVDVKAPSPKRRIKAEPFSLPPTPGKRQQDQIFSFLSSPQKSSSHWQPESLTSSPLPLPPWTSPQKHDAGDLDDRVNRSVVLESEREIDSLADFSLPLPPPLSSSRRQTPASSSL